MLRVLSKLTSNGILKNTSEVSGSVQVEYLFGGRVYDPFSSKSNDSSSTCWPFRVIFTCEDLADEKTDEKNMT